MDLTQKQKILKQYSLGGEDKTIWGIEKKITISI